MTPQKPEEEKLDWELLKANLSNTSLGTTSKEFNKTPFQYFKQEYNKKVACPSDNTLNTQIKFENDLIHFTDGEAAGVIIRVYGDLLEGEDLIRCYALASELGAILYIDCGINKTNNEKYLDIIFHWWIKDGKSLGRSIELYSKMSAD